MSRITPNQFLLQRFLRADGPDTNEVVSETTEQGLAISRPRDRHTLGLSRVGANINEAGLELIDNRLALQVEDLDAAGGSSAEPIAVRREHESIDDITSFKRV